MVGVRRLIAAGAAAILMGSVLAAGGGIPAQAASSSSKHVHITCEYSRICPDVNDQSNVFDEYTGHDEPSLLFYSDTPGSGNQFQSIVTIPKDPPPSNPLSRTYNFELNGTFWFGMALCDTQSYPEQVSTCTPDSDSNIVDPATSPNHPGEAFLELQFYPPGWVAWPTWAVAVGASTCDPTKWCAAMNIFSLLEDPVNGTLQNDACASRIGIETFQFAFVTKNGKSHAPANPLDATLATYTPNRTQDLFMSAGDRVRVRVHDTPNGVQAILNDLTSGQSGSMTASPANGFDQFQYDPDGTSCVGIPYAFHPMYSTSSEATRVTWAAHTYNLAFSDEIGHFQYCKGAAVPATPFGVDNTGTPISCPSGNTEELGASSEPTDGDDNFCFPASEALRFHVQGCTDTNAGFDGVSYEPVWPNGDTLHRPTPVQFTSFLTGSSYNQPYDRAAFEADLPAIERATQGCNRTTGANCTLIPRTDDSGAPAAFYPFFTTRSVGGVCNWQFGGNTPGDTSNFGENSQYGSLLFSAYTAFGGGGAPVFRTNNYRGIIDNPC